MNFGFATGAELSTRARRHKALGYSTFLLSDHVLNFASFTGMAAATLATARLRMGPA